MLTAALKSAYIDRALLRNMHLFWEFSAFSSDTPVNELTSELINSFIHGLVKQQSNDYESKEMYNSLKALSMSGTIGDIKACAEHFLGEFFERLQSIEASAV